jgi:hypothetical protein
MTSRGAISRLLLLSVILSVAGCASVPVTPRTPPPDVPPKPDTAPVMTRAEMRAFLSTAPIVAARPIGSGSTRPWRLTLSDGVVTWDGAFQSVDIRFTDRDIREGRRHAGELRFVDSYKYNIAAYELAELLGLGDMMPVTVERVWDSGGREGRRPGALSWWVPTLMNERERREQSAVPPDPAQWDRDLQRMVVFAELVYDTDRNLGNILITPEWRIVMIDFTRAFRLEHALRQPLTLQRCDRRLLAALRGLRQEDVREAVGPQLNPAELQALMVRRDLIVARFEQLIAERGEDRVLYDEPGGGAW